MAADTTSTPNATDLVKELADLEDAKVRAVNEKHGDAHGINLTKLRAVAKRVKTQHELSVELWATENPNARLLALLICSPRKFDGDSLDKMLRQSQSPKEQDWLVNYVVKKNKSAEELRIRWLADEDSNVSSAGWALTSDRVNKKSEGLDLSALLDEIETSMREAPERLQWAMNMCLAYIGIESPEHRERARQIGERLEVLKDYPTPPNCTSPFAPIWIDEMVRRKEETA
ncbi:DNA alkylation repair protein [Dietzia timorensis]|uniref:DNA alkylation repair enzyme n=1 Tax=Dietzia timorensis TaxID=499555 RepID=A0A173LLF0_9ACTN|nr:DNA alkylation repair protein [Dietzia timorensis]ANI92291.1 Uncharacterized protein BJL86_1513 [Dietzia timorensis]